MKLANLLPAWKQELPWLKKALAQPLQQTLKNLEQDNSRIFLPKLGWMRYRNSREVLGEIKNATVSFSGGKWFVSLRTEREVAAPVPEAVSVVGVDMGIARFATLSDGMYYAPLSSYKKHEQRLKHYQRAMSRKVKFSNNWKKAKTKVQGLHVRIGNARRDYLHQCSSRVSKNLAFVCVEDLQVKNMSRSASGSRETPTW